MLDIKFIKENRSKVEKAILDKQMKFNLERLLLIDEKRRTLKAEIDELREERNVLAAKMKVGKPDESQINRGRELKKLIGGVERKFRKVQDEFSQLMLFVPNIPSEDTPVGKDEGENVEKVKKGRIPKFDFRIKDHIELGESLDILDLRRGVKVGGFRSYFLKNEGVLLHLGILMFALQKIVEKGFTPMIPPTLNKAMTMYGTGWFPFDMDNIYKVAPAGKLNLEKSKDEGCYLVGTAEPPLCGYYADEVLKSEDLPKKLCGFSQCYRSEIGSYGRDTRGIYRIHEFSKVEQVILCEGNYEESEKWHQKLIQFSMEILDDLELPYRLIQMCTGDMGAGKYKMYDIETWMPSRNAYGETHSASNLGDWQARRLNIKYIDKAGEKRYVHMLNNTAIASPRILIALLENNQEKDGSVKVPKVLQKWVGKQTIKPTHIVK